MTSSRVYERICKILSRVVPEKRRRKIFTSYYQYSGIREEPELWLGKRVVLVLLIGIIGFLVMITGKNILDFYGVAEIASQLALTTGDYNTASYSVSILLAAIVAVIFMALASASINLHLFYQVDARASFVESVLPDFLLLVANNINAGMTPYSAFRSSTLKEFGPLSEEIKKAAAKSLGEESFTGSLKELSNNIKSVSLKETVSFFSQSLQSGGHLSALLETTALQLRQAQELKKELASSTKMYVIFVFFVVVIGAPLLLGLSVQFLKMVSDLQIQNPTPIDETGAVSFLSTSLGITPEFMQAMAIVLLVLNSILSSMFIGVISTGKAKLGLKNFPVILIASIAVFIVSTIFLSNFLTI